MSGNTAFISYVFEAVGLSVGSYSQGIHCNYIKKIDLGTSDPYIQEISLNFPNIDDFKFLTSDDAYDTGYTINRIYALVQIVDNTPFDTYDDITPDSKLWKQFHLTDQISGFVVDGTWVLTPSGVTSVVFKISLLQYTNINYFTQYNLDYLDYPGDTEIEDLVFGDATYFFGNVETKIKADVYTTDISVNLVLNEFNSSSNKTWDGLETAYISEIGIYDSNKNLVAIGKLNDPVAKDPTIARTIVFALDF